MIPAELRDAIARQPVRVLVLAEKATLPPHLTGLVPLDLWPTMPGFAVDDEGIVAWMSFNMSGHGEHCAVIPWDSVAGVHFPEGMREERPAPKEAQGNVVSLDAFRRGKP